MDINIIKSEERGKASIPWLKGYHSFSFGNYYNPTRMGFGKLIVFNDDIIAAENGFPMHPHDNAEVISIILEGELEHKDSMGSKGVIKEGDVQIMSTGTGIMHSEMNNSTKPTHILQIWLEPKEFDIEPRYDQKSFKLEKNVLTKIVSGEKTAPLTINQDAFFFLGDFEKNSVNYDLQNSTNGIYLFVINGNLTLEGEELGKGDSAEVTEIKSINLEIKDNSKFLIIETPF